MNDITKKNSPLAQEAALKVWPKATCEKFDPPGFMVISHEPGQPSILGKGTSADEAWAEAKERPRKEMTLEIKRYLRRLAERNAQHVYFHVAPESSVHARISEGISDEPFEASAAALDNFIADEGGREKLQALREGQDIQFEIEACFGTLRASASPAYPGKRYVLVVRLCNALVGDKTHAA